MELTSLVLLFRQIRVVVLTTYKLKPRVWLPHCCSVHLSHRLLTRHPRLLAEVCALRWPAVARLTLFVQAKQLVLITPGFCVKAWAAAGRVCNGSASQYSILLVAFSLNADREDVFPTMVNLQIFLLYFNNYYDYCLVCLISYCTKRKQIIFPLTEELDPNVSCFCRHMHVTFLYVLSIVLFYHVSFKLLKLATFLLWIFSFYIASHIVFEKH